MTFLCPALRNYALFQIPLAVALTLGCVGPIYALGIARFVRKENISKKVTIYTVGAVAGVVVLCLFGVAD